MPHDTKNPQSCEIGSVEAYGIVKPPSMIKEQHKAVDYPLIASLDTYTTVKPF